VLSSEPRELRFEWDLHSVVNVDGVYTAFASRIGDLPRLPIELRVEHPAVTFDRTRVEFRDDSDSALEVRSAPGRTLRIEKVTCPACVALVDADAPDGPYRMTFRESPLASRRHHCSPVQIEAFVGDDPEPFVRHVPVVHRRGIVEPDGTRALYGVFAPGEQLELLRDERGHLRIGYPQRVPCMVDAVESSARALEATFEVPQEPGALDVRIAGASGTIHLSGRIDSRAHQELAHWSEVCD
jgi:hypothetical protein